MSENEREAVKVTSVIQDNTAARILEQEDWYASWKFRKD